MNNLKVGIILFGISIIGINKCIAQAWTQKKGASYSQFSLSSITGKSKYNNNGIPLDLVRKVSDVTIQLYHEQGISDKWTIVGNVPIKHVSSSNEIISSGFSGNILPSGNLTSLGNVSLSTIYGLKQDAMWVCSIQLRTDLNTASENNATGLRTGVGNWGVAPSFHLGHSTNHFWTSFDIGSNFRTNKYSTQWFSNLQIGTTLSKSFDFIGKFELLQSLEDGNALDRNSIETGLYTNNLEYAAYSLKFSYEIKKDIKIWGTIGGGVSGHDVTRAPAFSLAISYKR